MFTNHRLFKDFCKMSPEPFVQIHMISEAFDRVWEKFVINTELNKYQREAILQIL